jgi:hypothetical protein
MLTILDVAPSPSSVGGDSVGSTFSPLSTNWPYLITILVLVLIIAILTYFLVKAKKKS